MCGLAAILLYPEKRSPQTWREIWEGFTQNLLFNENRGKSATGVGIFNNNQTVLIEKQTLSAHEFIKTEPYQKLLQTLNQKTTLILGHTRRPTKGSPININNNHPINVGSIYGIHNGQIINDDFLFEKWRFSRQAEVDSEVIFHLLANVQKIDDLEPIRQRFNQLEGQFTLLAVDYRYCEQLLVIKHQNPLSVHFCSQWKALIFSSSYLFLRKNFGSAVVHEQLASDQLSLFNANLLEEYSHLPHQKLSL